MNPNQPSNFQHYPPQIKPPQYINYRNLNQQHFTQNPTNVPRNSFAQGANLFPLDNNHFTKNRVDQVMYSSNIETALPNKNFAFGKLQSMGRFVGNIDTTSNFQNKPAFDFVPQKTEQYRQLAYQPQKIKPYQGLNMNNHQLSDFDRFPSFNLPDNHGIPQNISKSNFQPQNVHNINERVQNFSDKIESSSEKVSALHETLSPEEKRRRQILAIKQQLDLINKKMESSLFKKIVPENQKNIKITQSPISTSNYSNPPLINQPTTYTSRTYQQNSSKLNINRTNNANGDRSKGMIAQSMIVSSEPSSGYKYESIFDKYASLKKPNIETSMNERKKQILKPRQSFNEQKLVINNQKEDFPMLLDKFVHKGPLSQPPPQKNTQIQQNVTNTTIATNLPPYQFKSVFKKNDSLNNIQNNKTLETTQIALSFNSSTQLEKDGGMFKKKKVNFSEEIKIEQTSSSLPPNGNNIIKSDSLMKKSQSQQNDDLFNQIMKSMKIQESIQFKKEDFSIGKKLGKGQFGQVMLVQHKKTGFLCGMKIMEKKQIRDEKYEGQIARELSIQFYLSHRNIAPLYGYFQDQKNVYLLVQYCSGGQLLEMLRKSRRMEEPEVSRVIKQIIEGIDYIHKELIIHRDIKPQNILFNFGVAKICDFGWAVYNGHGMRKTASVGSPLYYSPQIVMGVEYDQKIDIWDVGMMTYECLLGKIPFRIYSELDLNRIVQDEIKFPEYIETTEEAKDFILRIMKKKPEERMEIRQMLRHPFITKYQDVKLPLEIMKDFKQVLSS